MSAAALSRVRARGHIGIRLGLERMRALLSRLDDPQASLRGVLVGGTNGKGSVAEMVASVLRAGGLRTSQAPSPHLSDYRERIIIDGRPISGEDLESVLDEVLRASEPGDALHGPATQFELLVAAAFLCSARQRVDVAVIEVGLGGRLDATNTWHPQVATITNVGLDHEAFLGSTLAAVATEKAAIIKSGSRAVTSAEGAGLEIIAARAAAVGAPLTVCRPLLVDRHEPQGLTVRHEQLGRLRLSLLGRHQARNAAVALGTLAALESAGLADLDEATLRRGLEEARWPGRLELLEHEGVALLLDGAHNPDGAAALAAALDELQPALPQGRATLMLAVLEDKDVAAVVEALQGSRMLAPARLVATRVPATERSLPASQLASAWAAGSALEGRSPGIEVVDDPDEALQRATGRAEQDGGLLVVSGSLYLVGHVRARVVPGHLVA